MTHHGPQTVHRATPNGLFDDDERRTLPGRWRHWCARVALVMTLILAVWIYREATPVQHTPVQHSRVIGLESYSIEKIVQVGDLTVVVGRLVSVGESALMNLFTINPSERPLPAGMTLDDGEGHQIEVGAGQEVPAKTMQRRVIQVDSDFETDSAEIMYERDMPGRGD